MSNALSIKTIDKEISNMSKPIIIVAFPGVGKTHMTTSHPGVSVVDLDRPDLNQEAYTALLKQALAIEGVTHVLLPSWPWLSDTLLRLGLDYTLVYPHPSLKSTYMNRYIQRGSPKSLIDTLDKNWDTFIESCVTRTATRKIVLTHPNEYLSDLLADEIATYTLTIDDTDQSI